jgi:hypothetical protein
MKKKLHSSFEPSLSLHGHCIKQFKLHVFHSHQKVEKLEKGGQKEEFSIKSYREMFFFIPLNRGGGEEMLQLDRALSRSLRWRKATLTLFPLFCHIFLAVMKC